MSAKAILSAKPNSFSFEDRVLILDIPAKIGRSHKDDQADSANGYFDCKVLSRAHAMILYEDGRFFVVDTGSSNGTFVNNIRLSKSGEESKMTEIFSNDILRFGSDIVDKSRQVTQKCVIGKIRLYHPDGNDVGPRPPESRLFRPTDSFEDLHAMTMSLQETLAREKLLEDKLLKVKTMISKNIGKSQTDLIRVFEDVKEELINMYQEREALEIKTENDSYEKLAEENVSLTRRLNEVEKQVEERDARLNQLQRSSQTDGVELMTLRKACQLQKQDLQAMETRVEELRHEVENARHEMEQERRKLLSEHEAQLKHQEEVFTEEKTRMKEQLHEVATNEVNLLNRIKSMEADEGYSRAEVDRILVKDRETSELLQQLQYRIDCLENELHNANQTIEEQKNNVVVQRSPEDVEKLALQDGQISSLQKEVSYLKQELIEARAHKSASDDQLGNVSGKLETLENTITSLSDEVTRLRKVITNLEDEKAILTTEWNHMKSLVEQMEASPGQDERNRVQIADLKNELAKREEALESRAEELTRYKKDLRLKDEIIQQREIDISCLRGQVQNIQEEMAIMKSEAAGIEAVKNENFALVERFNQLQAQMNQRIEENSRLEEDLKRQERLYNELKKMRGRGEEIDMLQQAEQQLRDAEQRIFQLEQELGQVMTTLDGLSEEKIRLMREVAKLKAGRGGSPGGDGSGGQTTHGGSTVPISPSEAALKSVGNLRLYEITLGIFFVTLILNWTIFPN